MHNLPTTTDWHRNDIEAALKKAGTNMSQLSRENGYSANAVSNAASKPYPRVEKIIAEKLGLTPEEIWPERTAKRVARKTGKANSSRKCVQAHSKKSTNVVSGE